MGGSVHTIQEDAEALTVAGRAIGVEEKADKTKYMVIFRDQNAGRICSIKIDSSSFEIVGEFRYLGRTLTHQNSIQQKLRAD